ncbi:MAG: L-2-amino-thiazoline-4-carboxylic acid hydrolase [Clostridia bacterium]|nr:L-2-amino-thiazoline-4-carboxylic acid hydrolase [Clostridia bacterium]
MKKYSETKMVIIGFGFLMGYLFDCMKEFVSEEYISTNIIAITADRETINEKRRKYPFKILLDDNISALRELKPDIILFAPPPNVAKGIIETELLIYFNECSIKPDIYAFPPSPGGEYYRDILGDDVFVCNILPNMVNEIGGMPLKGKEGYSTITYPDRTQFDKMKKRRLRDFLKPLGGTIEVKTDEIMDVLAAYVMIDLWPHRIINAARLLEFKHHKDAINSGRLEEYIYEVSASVIDFLIDSGLNIEKAKRIVRERNKLIFHLIIESDEMELTADMNSHSTRGGVFEKGIRLHEILIDGCSFDFLKRKVNSMPKVIKTCLRLISAHGKNLAGKHKVKIHPGIHAMVFGLYVRKLKNMLGDEADPIIESMVNLYGNQRGARMRQRAGLAGFDGSMETYMSFGEWTSDEGTMDIRIAEKGIPAVTRVYKCPWHAEWEKFGFVSEGEYYCRFVDKALVKGFNELLELGVNSIQTRGDEYCEFVWNGANMDGIRKLEEVNRIMPWEYHIAHLIKCIELSNEDGIEILDSIFNDIKVIYDVDLSMIEEEYRDCDFSSV